MRLLLHIFRKDTRHFFPEILVNLALLTAFGWAEPSTWQGIFWASSQSFAAALLRVLIPLGWLVMTSRVLHDEALVGDRQFWVTRPYGWPTLLAAKVCFILVFLQLPLFLLQAYLLHHAGFTVGPVLGRLMRFQIFVGLVYVLPLTAIAAVTASFGRQVLTVLAGLIYAAVVYAGTESLLHPEMPAPYFDWLALSLLFLTLVAVMIGMFARRSVLPARLALLSLPVAIALLALCMPTRTLVRRVYASTGSGDALQFDPDPRHRQPLAGTGDPTSGDREAILAIPVQLHTTGVTHEATVAGVQFTLRGADGTTWTSHFQSSGTTLATDAPELLSLLVPSRIYRKLQTQPTTLQIEAAVEPFAFSAAQTLAVPQGSAFTLANGAHCAPSLATDLLQCRYPLQTPPPVALALQLQPEPCSETGHLEPVRRRTGGATRGFPMDLDPVALQNIPLDRQDEATHVLTERQLCPGTQASFATERSLGRERLFFTTASLPLPAYAVPRDHSTVRNHDRGSAGAPQTP